MPPNFANAKIYAIRSHQTDKIYIGSTTQTLAQRFAKHKRKPCTSREVLQFDDVYIELLEEFPCANKMQLTKREGHLIRTMDCVNKQIAGRTRIEYYQDNKETLNEKTKQYYENNKTELKQYHTQYRIDNVEKINQKYNCCCGGKYINANKNRHFKSKKHLEFIRQLSA